MHPRPRSALIAISFLAFVSLGLPDGIGVGVALVRATFGLPLNQLGVLLTASMVGYLVSSLRVDRRRPARGRAAAAGQQRAGRAQLGRVRRGAGLGRDARLRRVGGAGGGGDRRRDQRVRRRTLRAAAGELAARLLRRRRDARAALDDRRPDRRVDVAVGVRAIGAIIAAMAVGFLVTLDWWEDREDAAGDRARIAAEIPAESPAARGRDDGDPPPAAPGRGLRVHLRGPGGHRRPVGVTASSPNPAASGPQWPACGWASTGPA